MGIKKVISRILLVGVVTTLLVAGVAPASYAIPILQLYIDGSTYDPETETWVFALGGTFDLWVIGDVDKFGPISEVKLTAAVATAEVSGGSISLTRTIAPIDPIPTGNFPSDDGVIPVRGDDSLLPTHGIYGPGTSFYEWALGDFTLTDSPIGDFINAFPSDFPDMGQINVYEVTVSGFTQVHFDTNDFIRDGEKHGDYKFAPFSHDAAYVAEPSTVLLLGSGLGGLALWRLRRRKGAD